MRLLTFLFAFCLAGMLGAQNAPCHIVDLSYQIVDCANGQFFVVLNFQHENTSDNYMVQGNGVVYGTFPYSQVPVTIGPLAANGTTNYEFIVRDVLHPDCFDEVIVGPVSCGANAPCEIFDLTVETGDCNSDGSYHATINFQVENPTSDQFDLWADGNLVGTYGLGDLPLEIPNFPNNPNSPNDVVRVCMHNNDDCCRVKEFAAPDCNANSGCEIFDIVVETGACNNDGTYNVTINFQVHNATDDQFDLWADGTYVGTYNLSALPLHLSNFPNNPNSPNDYVKICINDNDDCCKIKEFPAPNCNSNAGCEIYDLTAIPGDCNDDGTYRLRINFGVHNPGNDFFQVYANNSSQSLGTFPLSALPLMIEHFPGDGIGPHDVVRVCINDHPDCCKTLEFDAPDCSINPPECNVHHIVVETGDCNDDGTYEVTINFQVNNPSDDQFDLWANNNQYVGTFNLSALPLHISHFPSDGGPTDRVKICINDDPDCCRARNFPAPFCAGGNCMIWNVQVTHTPCVCGKFFALVRFRHKNGGAGGFDITGNGVNYGNFGYDEPLPVVIGPLDGDGTTNYEFNVSDHENPDCHASVTLGPVDCDDNFQAPDHNKVKKIAATPLSVVPNPATDRVQVMAPGQHVGLATVQIYRADGRLVRTETVAEGGVFTLDVNGLSAGVYRVRVVGEAATFAGDFVKQ